MCKRSVHRLVAATAGSNDDPAAADDLRRVRGERDIPRAPPRLKELPQLDLPCKAESAVAAFLVNGVAAGDLQLQDAVHNSESPNGSTRANLGLTVPSVVRKKRARLRDKADRLLDTVAARFELLLRDTKPPVGRVPCERPVTNTRLVGKRLVEQRFPPHTVALARRIVKQEEVAQ